MSLSCFDVLEALTRLVLSLTDTVYKQITHITEEYTRYLNEITVVSLR